MASRRRSIVALGLILIAAGAGAYILWPRGEPAPIVGVVRTTEIRIAPEVGGQLAAIKVKKGDRVRAGDVVAELSALELSRVGGAGACGLGRRRSGPQQRLCRCARGADRLAGGRDRQGEIAVGVCGTAAQPHRLPGAQRHRLAAGARPGAERRGEPHAPTSPRPKPTTTPRLPGRPKRNAPSRTRRSRQRRPRSQCWSDGSTRPSCGRRPTALSA